MLKRTVLIALVLVLGAFQPGLCGSAQTAGSFGCLDLVLEVVTAPCQLLATCLGMDGPQYGFPPPCRYKRPGAPAKKSRKNSAEEYSTKVVAPMPERSERPPVMHRRPPLEQPEPKRAGSPPVTREQLPQPPTAQPPVPKEPAPPERSPRTPAPPELNQPPALSPPRSSTPPAKTAVPSTSSSQPPTDQVRTSAPVTETAQRPPAAQASPPAPTKPKAPADTGKTTRKPTPQKERTKAPCGPVYPVSPCVPMPCWR